MYMYKCCEQFGFRTIIALSTTVTTSLFHLNVLAKTYVTYSHVPNYVLFDITIFLTILYNNLVIENLHVFIT